MGGRTSCVWLLAAAMAFAAVSCSNGEDGESTASSGAPTTASASPLQILVTNDDGVVAPGIDALVRALTALPDTEVTVVAPAENKSGSGSQTTPGPLTVTDATTASGYPAKAVAGYPADTIIWALDQGGIEVRPHLVVSGINAGQNLGPAVGISGTVGAAKAAASKGVPALAASQGLTETPDYPSGVAEVLSWLEPRRAELLAGTMPASVDNLNVPTCTVGAPRGVVEQPVAPEAGDRNVAVVDCLSSKGDFADDIDAYTNGYSVLSDVAA